MAARPREYAMAIESIVPHPVPNDLMPLQTISDRLRCTGHPASVSTIRRWMEEAEARNEAMYTVRRRSARGWRRDYVSFSDILLVHRDWVANKEP
ncbi:hypothetical protein [Streptomyces microflavus]|uniref:hypothetical protein n=1 Tax=Streptomyces microflavus TaxID=1919 RepID=UPI0033DA0D80